MAELVADLTLFPVEAGEWVALPESVYDHGRSCGRALSTAAALHRRGLLSDVDLAAVARQLEHVHRSPLVLTNGDLYPRNLIRLADRRLLLVDWEATNANNPFHNVDHLENVAAVPYAHMWGNRPWQTLYVSSLRRHFPALEAAGFWKGVVMASLALANLWLGAGRDDLVPSQVATIKRACRATS